jgi:hypothetical protein
MRLRPADENVDKHLIIRADNTLRPRATQGGANQDKISLSGL